MEYCVDEFNNGPSHQLIQYLAEEQSTIYQAYELAILCNEGETVVHQYYISLDWEVIVLFFVKKNGIVFEDLVKGFIEDVPNSWTYDLSAWPIAVAYTEYKTYISQFNSYLHPK